MQDGDKIERLKEQVHRLVQRNKELEEQSEVYRQLIERACELYKPTGGQRLAGRARVGDGLFEWRHAVPEVLPVGVPRPPVS